MLGPAKRINQLHLLNGVAWNFQKTRACEHDRKTARTADGYVKTILAVEKSVGAENTFSTDLTEFDAIFAELQPLIDKVWRHCKDKGTRGRTVTLKVKFADFELISRSRTGAGPIGNREELEVATSGLLRVIFPTEKAVRLLGISVSAFVDAQDESPAQISLL